MSLTNPTVCLAAVAHSKTAIGRAWIPGGTSPRGDGSFGPGCKGKGPADGRHLENLRQELPEAAAGGGLEQRLGRPRLDDLPMVHEMHSVGHAPGYNAS